MSDSRNNKPSLGEKLLNYVQWKMKNGKPPPDEKGARNCCVG